MTTLAAKPAGTHGDSSACNIHHKTKNKAAATAAAAVIYPEVDGERANLFFRTISQSKDFVGDERSTATLNRLSFLARGTWVKPGARKIRPRLMNAPQSIVNL